MSVSIPGPLKSRLPGFVPGAAPRTGQPPSRQPHNPRGEVSERALVLTISGVHALVHTIELAYAALLLRIEAEFGTDLLLLGVLANVAGFAFGLGALPAGFLVDRLGSMRVLRLTLIGASGAAMLVAASPSELALGATLALLGVVTGLYHPAGFTLLARTRRRAMSVGLHGVIGNLGVAISPVLLTGIALASDWRVAYVVLGILAGLAFLYTLRLSIGAELDRNAPPKTAPPTTPPPSSPAPSPASAAGASASASSIGASATTPSITTPSITAPPVTTPPVAPDTEPPPDSPTTPTPQTPAAPLRYWWIPLAVVYMANIIQGFVYRGSVTFIPTHIEEQITGSVLGVDGAVLAGALSTTALLGGALGWYIGGIAAERLPRYPLVMTTWLATAPLLVLISISSGPLLIFVIFVFVVLSFFMAPALVTLIADFSPPGRMGASFGLMFFLSFGLGSFAATLAGFTAEQGGTDAVFSVLATISVTGALLSAAVFFLTRGSRALPNPA